MLRRTLIILFGLFACLSFQTEQDPPKKQQPKQDTVKVTDRPADSIYIQQMIAKEKLDSLIKEKSKK